MFSSTDQNTMVGMHSHRADTTVSSVTAASYRISVRYSSFSGAEVWNDSLCLFSAHCRLCILHYSGGFEKSFAMCQICTARQVRSSDTKHHLPCVRSMLSMFSKNHTSIVSDRYRLCILFVFGCIHCIHSFILLITQMMLL